MVRGHDIPRAFKHLLQQVVLAVPVIGHQLVHWPKDISDLTRKQGSAKLWFSNLTLSKKSHQLDHLFPKSTEKIVDFDQHVHVLFKGSTPSSQPKTVACCRNHCGCLDHHRPSKDDTWKIIPETLGNWCFLFSASKLRSWHRSWLRPKSVENLLLGTCWHFINSTKRRHTSMSKISCKVEACGSRIIAGVCVGLSAVKVGTKLHTFWWKKLAWPALF